MRSLTTKCLFLMMAALLVMPVPAAAQDMQGKLGVGLSFFSDDGTATGFTVDYSRPIRSLANNRTLGWVGDFSFHRDSEDELGLDVDLTLLTFQGGVRFGGPLGQNDRLTWHAQGLLGVIRASASNEELDDLCDLVDEDCDVSETRFIFSPGAGIDYAFNDRTAFRAQLDLPLGDDISAIRFWIGISQKIGQ